MIKATVCIPWRPSPSRLKPYEKVRQYWAENFPDWEVVTADSDTEIFSLSQARNNACRQATTGVVVFCDADTIPPTEGVITAVNDPVGITWPHKIWRLIPPEYAEKPFEEFPDARILVEHPNGLGGVMVCTTEEFWRLGGQPEEFCVDDETEILTDRGWKRRTTVVAGDLVLTLNHATGMSEWQPIQKVNIYPGVREMLQIESKTHSSLTTMNHRWPVERTWLVNQVGKKQFQRSRRDWATSEKFQREDYVPIAAPCADLPVEPKFTDGLVESVAWFYTEGCISRLQSGYGRSVTISQSLTANPDHCDRIRSALTRAFGPASEMFVRRCGRSAAQPPHWRERQRTGIVEFSLNAEAGEILQQHAPNRVPSHEFLLSLTRAQLELFVQASIFADGHERPRNYERNFSQKDPAAAEAFQFACILAGYATSSVAQPVIPKYGYGMTSVSIRQQRRFKLSKGRHERVLHTGIVWCPTTENGTWLARRHGKSYFTGNSGWGHEDRAFHMVAMTLSSFRRIGGVAYSIEHNERLRVADSPEWHRDSKRNEALVKPYEIANNKPWLMRELLKIRYEEREAGGDWRQRAGLNETDPIRRELFGPKPRPAPQQPKSDWKQRWTSTENDPLVGRYKS
jgi:hypothetical protein